MRIILTIWLLLLVHLLPAQTYTSRSKVTVHHSTKNLLSSQIIKSAFASALHPFSLESRALSTQPDIPSAVPTNDNPCNAIPITPGPTCTFSTFSNVTATSTPGVPAP